MTRSVRLAAALAGLVAAVWPLAVGPLVPAAPAVAAPRPSGSPSASPSASQATSPAKSPTESPGPTPTPTPTPSQTPTPSAQDVAFLRAAHQDNLAEIQAGTAAEHRGGSGVARTLGTEMVRDHTSLDAQLQRIATRLGLDMPTTPTPDRQRQLRQIAAGTGTAFDRAWVAMVTDWNAQALSDALGEVRAGTLTEVRDLARDAAGVVRGHLSRMAEMPLDAPRLPTPARTNTDDYAASQSPLVVGVASGMIVLGAVMLGLTARAVLVRHRHG